MPSIASTAAPGGHSVAELLLQRAFARPPQPFVDADVILALTAAAHEEVVVATQAQPGDGPQVDVRV
jgi:hypothetical protein